MRKQFDKELDKLKEELILMGSLCEQAIKYSMKSLVDGSLSLFEKVEEIEFAINDKERTIENICTRLLLQQQPVAKDLRYISSSLKLISDMERIGDQAYDIAEITSEMEAADLLNEPYLKDMTDRVTQMVSESIDSFVKEDLDLAIKVIDDDIEVNQAFDQVKLDLIKKIKNADMHPGTVLDILMIAKYLERIGDHATNIAEWTEYSITGQHRKNTKEK